MFVPIKQRAVTAVRRRGGVIVPNRIAAELPPEGPDLANWQIVGGTGEISYNPTGGRFLSVADDDSGSHAPFPIDERCLWFAHDGSGSSFLPARVWDTVPGTAYEVTFDLSFQSVNDRLTIRYIDALGGIVTPTGSTTTPLTSPTIITHQFTAPADVDRGAAMALRLNAFDVNGVAQYWFTDPVLTASPPALVQAMLVEARGGTEAGYLVNEYGQVRYPVLNGAFLESFVSAQNRLVVRFEGGAPALGARLRANFTANDKDYSVRCNRDQGDGRYLSDAEPGMTSDLVRDAGQIIRYDLVPE